MKRLFVIIILSLFFRQVYFVIKEENKVNEYPILKKIEIKKIMNDSLCYKNVTATVYNAVPEQCNDDCFTTAFMFKLDKKDQFKHRIIAVSRDLLKDFPNKSKVRITGTQYDGIYTVRDKMNKRFKKRIDILINKDMKGDKWDNVKIEKVN